MESPKTPEPNPGPIIIVTEQADPAMALGSDANVSNLTAVEGAVKENKAEQVVDSTSVTGEESREQASASIADISALSEVPPNAPKPSSESSSSDVEEPICTVDDRQLMTSDKGVTSKEPSEEYASADTAGISTEAQLSPIPESLSRELGGELGGEPVVQHVTTDEASVSQKTLEELHDERLCNADQNEELPSEQVESSLQNDITDGNKLEKLTDALPTIADGSKMDLIEPGLSGDNGDIHYEPIEPMKEETHFQIQKKMPQKSDSLDSIGDTCCTRLAERLFNKALEMATSSQLHKKRRRPALPPKPSAEAVAQARAARAAALGHGFGEDFPAGRDGFRYIDDVSETSVDYKDVDLTSCIEYRTTRGSCTEEAFRVHRKPGVEGDNEEALDDQEKQLDKSSDEGNNDSNTRSIADDISGIGESEPLCTESSFTGANEMNLANAIDPNDTADHRLQSCDIADNTSTSSNITAIHIQEASDSSDNDVDSGYPSGQDKGVETNEPDGNFEAIPKEKQDNGETVVLYVLPHKPPRKKTRNESADDIGVDPDYLVPSDLPAAESVNHQLDEIHEPLDPASLAPKSLSEIQEQPPAVPPTKPPRPLSPPQVKPKPLLLRKAPAVPAYATSTRKTNAALATSHELAPAPPVKPKPMRPAPKPLVPRPLDRVTVSPDAKPVNTINFVMRNSYLNDFQSLPPAPTKPNSPHSPRTPPPRPPLPQHARVQSTPDAEGQKTETGQSQPQVEFPADTGLSGTESMPSTTPIDSSDPLPRSKALSEACMTCSTHRSDVDKEFQSTDHDDRLHEMEQSIRVNSFEMLHLKYAPHGHLTGVNFSDENSNIIESPDADITFRDALETHSDGGVVLAPERKRREAPKPPSRRRRRSRTTEIMPHWRPEDRSTRRSHSLCEADVMKRRETREMFLSSTSPSTAKVLYTQVSKESRTQDEENQLLSNSHKMRYRPLPPPPPPPRVRSRSSGTPMFGGEEQCSLLSKSQFFINKAIQTDPFHMDENANVAQLEQHQEKATRFEVLRPNYSLRRPENLESFDVVDPGAVFSLPSTAYIDGPHFTSSTVKEKPMSSPTLKVKSQTSWYDSEASGDIADLDTSQNSSQVASWESIETFGINRYALAQKDNKPGERRSSTFYYDLENVEPVSPVDEVGRIRDISATVTKRFCVDKGVQTIIDLQQMSDVVGGSSDVVSLSDKSEDTDDLLNLAMNIKRELNIILERHKKPADTEDSSEEYFTAHGGDTSLSSDAPSRRQEEESSSSESFRPGRKARAGPISSTYSSASEFSWHESSSEESEDETAPRLTVEEKAERKRKKKVFFIAKELMTSEEVFVDTLRLLNEDFRRTVIFAGRERGSPVVPEEVMNQMLKYLPQLQNLNESLLQEFKDRIEHWDEADKIADVLVKIGPFLKLYSSYIRDFDATTATLDEARKKYPTFGHVVREFEASSRCRNLALRHYMLKPVQRIPQYRLLLQEYLSHLPQDHWDYVDAEMALHIVSQVADHANETMRQGDKFAKLISIQNSIMGRYEIVKPGRTFIKEGELMKLSRKGLQPRRFMLFNDVLIYLTSVQPEMYKVNHELPLAGMKVSIPVHEDYHNEFSIISVTRSFSLAASSAEERKEWISAIQHAISINANKRSTFMNVRMQQRGHLGSGEDSTFVLGKQAPVWIPDARVTMCQLCTSEFTVTFRRHHCRGCGKVVCSACSANRAPLHYLHYRPARVCNECFPKLKQEFEAAHCSGRSSDDIATLSESADGESDSPTFWDTVKTRFEQVKRGPKMRKRPSVLKEVCANDQGSTISGYLQRQVRRGWRRDWFVLKDKVLYAYRASEDVAAFGSKPLLGYTVQTFTKEMDGINPSLLFQLSHPGEPPIVFHADTVGSSERWVKAMQEATVL